jgi:hypothetical protein
MSDGRFYGEQKRRSRELSRRIDVFPSFEEIARRANKLFLSGGRNIDTMPEYWRRAEEELLNRAARLVCSKS